MPLSRGIDASRNLEEPHDATYSASFSHARIGERDEIHTLTVNQLLEPIEDRKLPTRRYRLQHQQVVAKLLGRFHGANESSMAPVNHTAEVLPSPMHRVPISDIVN
jgi:hypothetical protein